MRSRTLRTGLALGAVLLAGLPTVAQAGTAGATVCNEAENSHRGGYVVNGGPVDPVPPAFLRGSQMRVGNGKGAGLAGAAQHSPALRTCGPPAPDTGGDDGPVDGGDTGGDDGPTDGGDTGGDDGPTDGGDTGGGGPPGGGDDGGIS